MPETAFAKRGGGRPRNADQRIRLAEPRRRLWAERRRACGPCVTFSKRVNDGSRIVVHVGRDAWTFLTNHGHVLVCLAADPDVLLRDVAVRIGITERAVQQIIGDLERAGVIVRIRVGRRNRYLLRREEHFRHALEHDLTIGEFVDVLQAGRTRRRVGPASPNGGDRAPAGVRSPDPRLN